MGNNQITILLLVLTCCVYSCSFKSNCLNEKHEIITIDLSSRENSLSLSPFISEMSTIKLELPSPYFWGVVTDVLFTDSTLFVVDKKGGNVFHFRKDGVFLNKIGNRGEAPGEFLHLHSSFINEDHIFICDIKLRKIHCYTHSGKYIKTISSPMNLVYDDIFVLPNGKFLCHDIQGCKGESKIWLMNGNGEKEKTLLFHENNFPYSYSDWNTINSFSDKEINILDPITGIVYLYDVNEDELFKVFQLLSDRKNFSSFSGTSELASIKEQYAFSPFIINAMKYVYSIWSTSDEIVLFSLYEKDKDKIHAFKTPCLDTLGYSMWPLPVSTNLPNAMVTVITDECPLEYYPECYKENVSEQIMLVNIMKFKHE
ncbi:BF3164 family lipoprotein [uncultured Bacteroides sp.]|uniref:BF3164 family lipoprotein n=1 Tax=uncultured Bacteroides sp. TaxID=162156 RepID=UPI002630E1B1|nr:BF3164 family lipoprotein [uncultured Bacteroides sp.]